MSNVDQFIDDSISKRKGRMEDRFTKETLIAYQADLRRILERSEAGEARPSIERIQKYVKEAHDMAIGQFAIRDHLRRLSEGETLWA